MSIVRADVEGLRRASRCLDTGTPLVAPLPPPRAYVVAGSDAAAVNEAKARPPHQPVGVAVIDFFGVRPYVDLDEDDFAFARWLTSHELVNLFVPVRPDFPDWMLPSVSDGWLAITTVSPEGVGALWEECGHLYVSSANCTGSEVARTAATADAAFDGELLVLEDVIPRDPQVASGSATIIRIGQGGIELVRPGINDVTFPGDHDRFLSDLTRRWAAGHGASAYAVDEQHRGMSNGNHEEGVTDA